MDESSFPIKKLREPKIIVFQEPGRKKKNDNNNKPENRKIRKIKNIPDENEDETEDFISIAREVKEFGISGFTRKEQKKNKQKYAEHLGAHKQKPQKVPYPMLMQRIKKRKEKEGKEAEMERAMGVFRKKKTVEKEKLTSKLNLGRWVDKSSVGKGSIDTHLKVNKKDLVKMKTKTK